MLECKTLLVLPNITECKECNLAKKTWKYCSKHRLITIDCVGCGRVFATSQHNRKYCSSGCSRRVNLENWPKFRGLAQSSEARSKARTTLKRVWYNKMMTTSRLNALSLGVVTAWKEGKYDALKERRAERLKLAIENFKCKVCGIHLNSTRTITSVRKGKTYSYSYPSFRTMCKSCKSQWLTMKNKNFFEKHPEKHPTYVSGIRNRCSSIELEMREILTMLGVDWEKQFHIGRFWIDLAISSRKLLIECDGVRWHKDIEKDKERDSKILLALGHGWRIIHFGETEIHRLYRNRSVLTYAYLLERGIQLVIH